MDDAPPTEGESIGALLSRVVSDAEQVARAEIELQKARLVAKVDGARNAILLLLAAVAIGSVALTALVVGALLSLARFVGPIWATLIIVALLSALAALCGWLSMRHFRTLFSASGDEP